MALGTQNGNIFISSNGGMTWTLASQPVENAQEVVFSPLAPYELWVSDCCFCVPQHVYKSTNLSYTQWITTIDSPLADIAFPTPEWGDAYSTTVYATGCWDDGYRSTDNGDSWENWGPATGSWGHSLAPDPQSPGTIYHASHQNGVYKTTDGGENWQVTNQGLTAMAPAQLATVPGQPDLVYALVDGWEGIFKGTRGGDTWQF